MSAAAGSPPAAPRRVGVLFREPWGDDGQGLFAPDPRLRTLRRVLVSYPGVRHILPDAISLEPGVDPQILQTLAQLLRRQQWLVRAVAIE
jgi:hypothetical protein